jgi:RNA polymerase sigma factor (sigma-70 family)
MRLLAARGIEWEGRGEFFRVASGVIRRILADQFRRKLREPHSTPLNLEEQPQPPDGRGQTAETRLHRQELFQRLLEALGKLEQEDADAATVFELRFFGGRCLILAGAAGNFEVPEPANELLPFTEVGAILDIPRSTAHARWLRAVTRLQIDLHAFAPAGMEDTAHD